MTMLGQAIWVAALAHKDDVCKANAPYSLHWIKVMHDVRWMGEEAQCAAAMHDVKEDHPDVWEEHQHLFSPLVQRVVDSLSRREGESYWEFILRCSQDPVAIEIKLMDIKHNSDLRRMPLDRDITEKDLDRARKYRLASIFLYRVKRGEETVGFEEMG